MTTTTPLELLARRHERYARELHQQFAQRLSLADCADCVQEAFIDASVSARCRELDETVLDRWLRAAARHNALDAIKAPHREGQGAVPRRHHDLDGLAEVLTDDGHPIEERDEDGAVLRAAFERLPAPERQVLGLRHFDDLPVERCAELVGVPRTKYERRHTDAVQRLVNLVVGLRPHDTCREARRLVDLSVGGDLLEPKTAARRDAHLAGCLHCRQYQRRGRGLLGLVPLPFLLAADRLQGLLGRLLPAGGASGAAEAGGVAAGAGGLGAGVTLKVAALVASGVAAVGGGRVALEHHASPAQRPAARTAAMAPAPVVRTVAPLVGPATTPRARPLLPKPERPSAPRRRARGAASAAPTAVTPRTTSLGTTRPTPITHARTTDRPGGPEPDSSSGEFVPHP